MADKTAAASKLESRKKLKDAGAFRGRRPKAADRAAALGPFTALDTPQIRAALALDGAVRLPRVRPGEWLAEQEERGQSFRSFGRRSVKIAPHGPFTTIGLVPLGDKHSWGELADDRLLPALAALCTAYFGRDVALLPHLLLAAMAAVEPSGAAAAEGAPASGVVVAETEQLLANRITAYLSSREFRKDLPRGIFATMAVSMADLTIEKDGELWNYVFGQASLMDGVGAFSFYRYQDENEDEAGGDGSGGGGHEEERYRRLLLRSAKVLVHELGHILGLRHCIYFQCRMNGHNSLEEADASPLFCCPVCLRKVYISYKDPSLYAES